MESKAATLQTILSIGDDIIVLSQVKGDSSLFRVMINSHFKGYVQRREKLLHRIDGSLIKDNLFSTICIALEQ